MGYSVRLLAPSASVIPLSTLQERDGALKLVSGREDAWDSIEISGPEGSQIALLERYSLFDGGPAESEMQIVRDALQGGNPVSALRWLRDYLGRIKVIYAFRLKGEEITHRGWPVLGRVQNKLKDALGGIIQADQEGFYNEEGDFILWQMYEGASGSIPAAVLDEKGEWKSYQLRLNDAKSVDCFKHGLVPPQGFLGRLLGK